MKVSLFNLFCLTTIVGLIVALVVATQKKVVTISGDYYDTWLVLDSVLEDSLWIDKSKAPPLTAVRAYEIAASAAEVANADSTANIRDWEVIRLSLESFSGGNHWFYMVTLEGTEMHGWDVNRGGIGSCHYVYLLVFMDGTAVFDQSNSTIGFEEFKSELCLHTDDSKGVTDSLQDERASGDDKENVDSSTNPFTEGRNPFSSSDDSAAGSNPFGG